GIPLRALESAGTLCPEDAVELLDGELRSRIVFVNEDANRVTPSWHVEAPGNDGDLHWKAAVVALVEQRLVGRDVAIGRDVRHAEGERWNAGERRLQLVLELDGRVVLFETVFPHFAEGTVGKVIRSPLAKDPGHFLLRRVGGQVIQVPLLGVIALAAAQLELLLAPLLDLE